MTEEARSCKICHLPFDGHSMGEKGAYKLVACKSCGSVMAEPWPTTADLDKFFGDIQPEIVHMPNPANEIRRARKILEKMLVGFKGRRFLDVACRQGYAVMAAKELNLQAEGIDPHDFFIAFAKDKYEPHLFEHLAIQDYAAKKQQADIVFAIETFCEQIDPESCMVALSKIIPTGGLLYMQEPDGNHFRLPKKFSNWLFVDPPLNFVYISRKGMEALLGRHGFKIKKSFFTWAPFMRLIAVKL